MSSKDAVVMSLVQETVYLFTNAANAARLQAALVEADASLPVGARILEPTGSTPECHIVE